MIFPVRGASAVTISMWKCRRIHVAGT